MRMLLPIVAVLLTVLSATAGGPCNNAAAILPGHAVYQSQTITYSQPVAAVPACQPCTTAAAYPAALPVSYQQQPAYDVAALSQLLQQCQTVLAQPAPTVGYTMTAAALPVAYAPSYAPAYAAGVSSYAASRQVFAAPVYHASAPRFLGPPVYAPTYAAAARFRDVTPVGFGGSVFGNLRARTAAGAGQGGLLGAAEGLTGLGDGSGQFLQGALIARFLPGGGGFRFKR